MDGGQTDNWTRWWLMDGQMDIMQINGQTDQLTNGQTDERVHE